MKRFANGLALTGLLSVSACGGTATGQFNQTYTLQGIVADAVTGARIGGGDLKLLLVQGVDIRGPSRLITDTNDSLAGEYAFAGIPVDINSGNKRYKVVAIKPGYLRFESEIFFASAPSGAFIDTVYNFIGNIYLFPLGSTAPSYAFTVTYNGKPVPNATVLLDPIASDNSATHNTGKALPATNGYLASLQVTTGADGKASFAGSTLALGAAYRVEVLPVVFTDSAGTSVQLARFVNTTTNLVAGLDRVDQPITLTALRLANLFVAKASSRPQGQLAANGQLVITFNASVALVNPNGFAATLTPGTNAAGTAAGSGVLSGTQPVTASLSPDGLTLTLAPNYTTPPAATDRGVSIVYNNGTAIVAPKDYPASSFPVFGTLLFVDTTVFGTVNDRTVNITGP